MRRQSFLRVAVEGMPSNVGSYGEISLEEEMLLDVEMTQDVADLDGDVSDLDRMTDTAESLGDVADVAFGSHGLDELACVTVFLKVSSLAFDI